MPRKHPRLTCKSCNRHRDQVGEMTHSGLCLDCGHARRDANIMQLIEHRGEYFDHWRARCLAAFGVSDSQPGR